MGNCCSSGRNESGNFDQPGRVLGTAPPKQQAPKAAVPSQRVGGTGRILGGGGPVSPSASASSPNPEQDARRRAAQAAEARAKPNKPLGKLGQELAQQQKQSRVETLKDASEAKLTERELRDQSKVLNYD